MVYYMPTEFKIVVVKPKQQICICLVTADQGGKKKTTMRKQLHFFFTMFSTGEVTMKHDPLDAM